jgi:MFS transporter, DHA1 family, multidrug resistance protein
MPPDRAELPIPASPPVPATATPSRANGRVELTTLLALSMSLAALGIDLLLPAFGAIRSDLGLPADSTAVTGLITMYFLGLAGGQLIYGPLADRFGRRPTLFLGYGIYAIGALAGAIAPSLEILLASRLVWGLGAAGPRVVTLAIVRDKFEGERMSRAMSFIMAVFILVPVLSPSVGALLLLVVSWRALFVACVVAAAAMAVWAARRLPETLRPEHRRPLQFSHLREGGWHVVTHRQTIGYTLAMTALYGAFASYLASSEAIFAQVFDAERAFPVLFAVLAGVMGVGMLANAWFVERVGTRRLSHSVMVVYLGATAVLLVTSIAYRGVPPLWAFMIIASAIFGGWALLIPNFNTVAMHPMAPIAGTASSLIGAVQVAGGAIMGAALDRLFDGTILPLSVGFVGFGLLAFVLVLWAEGGRLFQPLESPVAVVTAPDLPT